MNILITGFSGFIGQNLLQKLKLEKKYKFLLLSRSNKKFNSDKNNPNIKFMKSDLKYLENYEKKILKFDPNIVIHLAWEGIPKFDEKLCRLNYENSIKLANLCEKIKSLKKFISLGSCLEYKKKFGSCEEHDKLDRKNLFPIYKNKINSYFTKKFYNSKIDYYWFRVFYVYGAGQRKNSLMPFIISRIKKNKKIEIKYPKDSNDFVYIDDLISAIKIVINNKIKPGTYNLGSGASFKNYEIFKKILKNINSNSYNKENLILHKARANRNFYANLRKIKKYLNWKPETNIEDGIKQVINDKYKS